MKQHTGWRRLWRKNAALALAFTAFIGLFLACGGRGVSTVPSTETRPQQEPPATASAASPAPILLKQLKTEPPSGQIGGRFAVTGEGLPVGKAVEFQWVTWDGAYDMNILPENVQFFQRKFTEKRVPLGRATVDAQGRVSANLNVPDDYGESHDLYATIEAQDVARGGFRILRTATMTPTEGPVGTPITIVVKGIGAKLFDSTMSIRYDNKYTGFASGTTTRGTATFQIRAAGPVGKHVVQLMGAATALPYLNNDQSPTSYIPWEWNWGFTVTRDAGPPQATIEWPEKSRVAQIDGTTPRTTAGIALAAPHVARLEPSRGPILSQTRLRAEGLPPNGEVELFWVTVSGSDASPTGWNLSEIPLQKAATNPDGSLNAALAIPEGLGGWHVVKLVQGTQVLKEVPFYVERSMIGVTPQRVKAGQKFNVQIKGIGWTDFDNGVGVTYDNAYIGFACGFGTGGDITLPLVATGGPGTHLIDLYPMIYQGGRGKAKPPWTYQMPILTALEDGPGLALGYNLPIFRFAIEVVE